MTTKARPAGRGCFASPEAALAFGTLCSSQGASVRGCCGVRPRATRSPGPGSASSKRRRSFRLERSAWLESRCGVRVRTAARGSAGGGGASYRALFRVSTRCGRCSWPWRLRVRSAVPGGREPYPAACPVQPRLRWVCCRPVVRPALGACARRAGGTVPAAAHGQLERHGAPGFSLRTANSTPWEEHSAPCGRLDAHDDHRGSADRWPTAT